jgi:uncharacterized repeat protein (TIGR03803 family)
MLALRRLGPGCEGHPLWDHGILWRVRLRHSLSSNKEGHGDGALQLYGRSRRGPTDRRLAPGQEGNLYGTTNEGGASGCFGLGCGTVFELTPAGAETVLHAFAGGADGENPVAALVRDAKSNLYGTTGQGGARCRGTIFEINPAETETTLFNFTYPDGSGPGLNPFGSELGNFYGTTSGGGAFGYGIVFEITKKGTEKLLYSFSGAADGFAPCGGAIRDAKGYLYGTAFEGAGVDCNDDGCGTVFGPTPAGEFKVLHTFTGRSDGGNAAAGLVMDRQGILYSTT